MPVPAHVIVATAAALVLATGGPIAQLPAERRPQYEQAGRELREWPAFDALAEVDPEAYTEIGRMLKQAAAKPSAKAALQDKAWEYFAARFGGYVFRATDGAIIRYYQVTIRVLEEGNGQGGAVCQSLLERRVIESRTSEKTRDALFAATENLINSARGRTIAMMGVMPDTARVYLDNIINRISETPRDKEILDKNSVAPADRVRRCQLEMSVVKEITRQPVGLSADLLRLLATRNLTLAR